MPKSDEVKAPQDSASEWLSHRNAEEEPHAAHRVAFEWVVVLVVAVVAAFIIKTFLVQTFFIPSASMEDTLVTGDRVLVNKLAYKVRDVKKGDVVVFERPPSATGTNQIKDLIKRVVAFPGDRVEARDGLLYINGEKADEPYVKKGVVTTMPQPIIVPPGHLFVMGDNRENSQDSRVIGPIPESLIIGRAFVIIWPPFNVGLL